MTAHSGSSTLPAKVDVLVVGAGPVGLTMACELRRHGLSVRIVDQKGGPTHLSHSKALAVHPRTLEMLQAHSGVVDALMALGTQVRVSSIATLHRGGMANVITIIHYG